MSVHAAVIGASGHSGGELCRLLLNHPAVERISPTSREDHDFERLHTNLAGSGLRFVDRDALGDVDVAFFCTPSGEALRSAPALLEYGARVIDLSPDFRFRDPAAYEAAYDRPHTAPDLLEVAACGITELHRPKIARARLVAHPGCYVITAVLALAPLLEREILDLTGPLHLHAINGTSGAGSSPRREILHANAVGSVLPYSLDGHRHGPELEARFAEITGHDVPVSLTVAHGDFARGVYLQASVPLAEDLDRDVLLAIYRERYGAGHDGEHFVLVTDHARRGALNEKEYDLYPQLGDVIGTNFCRIGVDRDRRSRVARVVAVSDNLIKGAAGSAIQNMNVMLGLEETAGLRAYAL
jgi:N-acetyl-gamma-glutamyl-phosphate reductase